MYACRLVFEYTANRNITHYGEACRKLIWSTRQRKSRTGVARLSLTCHLIYVQAWDTDEMYPNGCRCGRCLHIRVGNGGHVMLPTMCIYCHTSKIQQVYSLQCSKAHLIICFCQLRILQLLVSDRRQSCCPQHMRTERIQWCTSPSTVEAHMAKLILIMCICPLQIAQLLVRDRNVTHPPKALSCCPQHIQTRRIFCG